MGGAAGRSSAQEEKKSGATEPDEAQATEAAAEVLHPAIPPAGAAILMETDPRLHQPSETEEELRALVESNEAADKAATVSPKT